MYELFTGRSPFVAPNAAAVLRSVCSHRQQPAREVNPELPAELSDLIDRLLEKEPVRRPQSAAEVALALAEIAAGGPLETPPAGA
ncbi:MAG: WD40 repeat domain-containing serine/threonine protein kinase, partial [Thermoanaerobaculia bacterium]